MKTKVFITISIVAAAALFALPAFADYPNMGYSGGSNSFQPAGYPATNMVELDQSPPGAGLYLFCSTPTTNSGTPDPTGYAFYNAQHNGIGFGWVAMTNLGGGWYYLPPNTVTLTSVTDVGFANAALSQNTACGPVAGAGATITLYSHLPGPQMTFILPTNGTTTPAFDHYLMTFTGLTSTDQYFVNVQKTYAGVAQNSANSLTVSGGQLLNYGEEVNSEPLGITVPATVTSVPLFANAQLYDVTNFRIPENLSNFIVASTSVSYNQLLEPVAGVVNGYATSTFLHTYIGGNASSGFYPIIIPGITPGIPGVAPAGATTTPWGLICGAPSTTWLGISSLGSDLSFAACQTVNFLFVPNQAVVQTLQGRFSNIAGDFPFNMVYGPLQALASTTASIPNPSSSYDLYLPIFGAQIPVLTSTSLSSFIGTPNKNLVFGVEDNLAWIGSAWSIVTIIF